MRLKAQLTKEDEELQAKNKKYREEEAKIYKRYYKYENAKEGFFGLCNGLKIYNHDDPKFKILF